MLLSPSTDLAARFEVQRQAFARESYPSWQVRISRLDQSPPQKVPRLSNRRTSFLWSSYDGGAMLYLHGGAFCLGGPGTRHSITTRLAVESGMSVWVARLLLGARTPVPCRVAGRTGLLREGYAADRIVVAGDSVHAVSKSMRRDGMSFTCSRSISDLRWRRCARSRNSHGTV